METLTTGLIALLNLSLGITLALLMLWVVERARSLAAGAIGLVGAVVIIAGQAWVGEVALAPVALSEFKFTVLAAIISGVTGLLTTFTAVRPEI